jgi:hypothetical protein
MALPRDAAAPGHGPGVLAYMIYGGRVREGLETDTFPGRARAFELRLFLAPLGGRSSSIIREEPARPLLRRDLLVHDGYHSLCGNAVEVLGVAAYEGVTSTLRAVVPVAGGPSRAPGSTGGPCGGERPLLGAHCPTVGPPPRPTEGCGRMCPLRPNAGEAACEDLATWVVWGLPTTGSPPAFPDATPAPAAGALPPGRVLAPPLSAPIRVQLD